MALMDPKTQAALAALKAIGKVELPKSTVRLKSLGGALGRYSSQLEERSKMSEDLLRQIGNITLADDIRKMMTGFKSKEEIIAQEEFRKAVNALDSLLSDNIKSIKDLQVEIQIAKDAGQTQYAALKEDELKRAMENLEYQDAISVRLSDALDQLGKAKTAREREFSQNRLEGVVKGEELLLKNREDAIAKLEEKYNSLTDAEKQANQQMQDQIVFLKKQSDTIKTSIFLNSKVLKQLGGGYFRKLLAKSFRGGLYGILMKGEGFDDLVENLQKDVFTKIFDPKKKRQAFIFGAESEEAQFQKAASTEAAMTAASGEVKLREEAAKAGIELTDIFSTRGSGYVHDIHTEKILLEISKMMEKMLDGKLPQSGGGSTVVAGSIGKGGGIGGFLTSIANGVKSFGNKDVLKGALGLAAIGASIIPFALGLKIMSDVPVEVILSGTAAIMGMGLTAAMLGKIQGDILKGSIAMIAIGAAAIPAAFAFSLLGNVDPGTIATSVLAIAGLSAIAFALGLLATGTGGVGAAAIAIGAGLMALIGAAFIPFAYGVSLLSGVDPNALMGIGLGLIALVPGLAAIAVMSPLLVIAGLALAGIGLAMIPMGLALRFMDTQKLNSFAETISAISKGASSLKTAAVGIAAVSAAIVAFAAATAIGAISGAVGGIVSEATEMVTGEETGPIDQILMIANRADDIMKAATAIQTLGTAIQTLASAFSSLETSSGAMDTINKLINLDATQLQTLQDVSVAMDRVMTANDRLRAENQANLSGAAAGGGAAAVMVTNNTSVGSSSMIFPTSGRNPDPSVVFSSTRYYSMIYR